MSKYQILNYFDNALIEIENVLGTDKSTTNFQLQKLGNILFGYRFKGVYSSNSRFILKNNEMAIINTAPSNSKGVHWLAIFAYNNNKYVWDSFARDYKTLSKYFKNKRWINTEFNNRESYEASNCGQLSLAFLLTFDKFKTKCIGVI